MQLIGSAQHKDRIYNWLAIGVIAVGVWLRLWVYLANRTLIMDEVNVALNVHKRGYAELLQQLDYNQYAPPGFLCMLKLCTHLLGYGEYGFRLFPMLCGIASMYVLYKVLRLLTDKPVIVYALWFLATGYIFLYYATTVKQYSSDVLIVLLAIWLALRTNISQTGKGKFIVTWALAGTLLWFSMPLVFVLSGVACYYLYAVWKQRSWQYTLPLFIVFAIWSAEFGVYYFGLLKQQVGTGYLQGFHKEYFSVLWPASAADWAHNGKLYGELLAVCTGNSTVAYVLHIGMMLVALVFLFIKAREQFFLFIVPVVCFYVASGLHMYTLIPRVALFIMPVLLTLIAIGLNVLFSVKNIILKGMVVITLAISAYDYAPLKYIYQPLKHEEFKDGMEYALQHGITGRHFHVCDLIENVLFYYTNVHPDKQHWAPFKNAHLFPMWGDIESEVQKMTHDAVIYAWYPEDLLNRDVTLFNKYCTVTTPYIEGMHFYVCTRK